MNTPSSRTSTQGGESQRSVHASNSRKRWRLAKRLAPGQLVALSGFYDAREGPEEPLYFSGISILESPTREIYTHPHVSSPTSFFAHLALWHGPGSGAPAASRQLQRRK
jgi:hypothetical protein